MQQQDLRVVVLGAGMAGILAAIKLLQSGVSNIAVYEKAERIGGTWRENTYPGLTCDVPSHAYTYSFERNPEWSRQLPPGAEIQAYFEKVVDKYGLSDFLHFEHEARRCEFREGRWHLDFSNGYQDQAHIVIAATGVLHHPRYPDIEGMESFTGALFHTARWDHSVKLKGKRVGVVGNGSTGVQIISALVDEVSQLIHFQRSAQWIMPVENPLFSDAEKQQFREHPELMDAIATAPEYLGNVERFNNAIIEPDSEAMAEIEAVLEANLVNSVSDPVLQARLRPNYRAACKRLIYSPDYYQAIQQDNAILETTGISRIEEKGIRLVDGSLHELDVIALATGFQADRFVRPMQVVGRDGLELDEVWAERPSAYLAVSVPDFPNFFMLNGPNGPVGNFSLIDIAEQQWSYLAQIIGRIRRGEILEASASRVAMQRFDAARIAAAKKTVFASGCQSWYLDARGVPATWPWSPQHFSDCMQTPDWADFDIKS
jgi:cation diffusion facilitator CzcD-associated flavoprotein CzcO